MALSAISMKDDLEEDASDDKRASLRAARGPLLALGATVLSCLSAEFMALSSKGGIPSFQLLFFLNLTQLLVVLVCLVIFRPKLIGDNRRQNGLLLLETFVNNIATSLVFLSFTFAAPGIAFGIIQGSMPLFTACFGFIFLKETIGLIPCCGILISATGVVIVSIGMVDQDQAVKATQVMVESILLPLAAGFMGAPDMVLIRAIQKDVSGLTMLFYIQLLGAVATLILTLTLETPVWVMSTEIAGFVAGLGLSEAVALLFLTAVLKYEKAAIAVALRTLVTPFTILLDFFILYEVPNLLKWLCRVALSATKGDLEGDASDKKALLEAAKDDLKEDASDDKKALLTAAKDDLKDDASDDKKASLTAAKDDLEEDDSKNDKRASLKAARGPLLALGATVLSCISAEFMALSSEGGIPRFQLLFLLNLTQLLVVLVCLVIFRPKLMGENRRQNGLLLLEAFINNIATSLVFLSFTFAAPGIAFGIIQGSMPLFTACFGFIFLKETIGLIPCCGILISVTGVVLVTIAMVDQAVKATLVMVESILLPLAAGFMGAPDMVLILAIQRDVSGFTMLFYIQVLGTLAALTLTLTLETPVWVMSAEIAGYVAGLGLFEAVALLFMTAVLKFEKAAIAVALRTLVTPFTILLDYFILSEVPNVLKWVVSLRA
ncbi:SLC35G2 [Branchiostoma lanceolatum]|uniref:SLC35G2 protein n=1 Tax=Branchiostoma lanceolatum TaxID=7740 RepID=A0A8K0ERT4_BRALA|nr:SLC35G2 [Branchiostoma lanceolatum]